MSKKNQLPKQAMNTAMLNRRRVKKVENRQNRRDGVNPFEKLLADGQQAQVSQNVDQMKG